MRPTNRRLHFACGVVVIGAMLPVVLLANPAGGTPLPASSPQLSITLDDGHKSAAIGDRLGYTIAIKNIGTTAATGLVITQSVPAGLTLESAQPTGVKSSTSVSWTLNLAASSTTSLHTAMTVSATPKDLLRLASVACATQTPTGPPIVCAAHSDELPAGAAAVAARSAGAIHASSSTSTGKTWYLTGGGLLVLIALYALVMRRAGRSMARPHVRRQ